MARLEEFVKPYYAQKDIMHNLWHIKRFLDVALSLSKRYRADNEILTYAAYVHGIDQNRHRKNLTNFLESQGLQKRKVRILLVARESGKKVKPKTIEGKLLHDAHLVEGGRTFLVTRCLVTGAVREYSLGEIIDYFEERIDGKFKCYLPETQKMYKEKEKFAREFFHDLKGSL